MTMDTDVYAKLTGNRNYGLMKAIHQQLDTGPVANATLVQLSNDTPQGGCGFTV